MVYHIVLLSFQPGKEEQFGPLSAALEALRLKLPGFQSCRGGPYASPEGLHQGYTHGFVMTFADAAVRDLYLTHPEHERLKADFLPFVANVVAFDFES
jgi:hypothetical protein